MSEPPGDSIVLIPFVSGSPKHPSSQPGELQVCWIVTPILLRFNLWRMGVVITYIWVDWTERSWIARTRPQVKRDGKAPDLYAKTLWSNLGKV